MLCIAWVGSAWADTTLLTEANGWQKVTDLSTLTLSDYYFAFVDNDKDLMLSFEEAPSQSTDPSFCTMVYRTGARAELKHTMLWILEENPSTSGAHLIKSAYYNDKFLQTEDQAAWYCRTHNNGGGTGYSWGAWKFAYADSKWSIENVTFSGNFVGPWGDAAFQNGMQVAGNKTGSNVGYFQIYAILRTTADGWQANASKDNPADITFKITNPRAVSNANGWTAGGTNSSFGRNKGTGTFTGLAGFFEPSNWGASNYNITVTQTINDLPAGKYKVRAAGQNSSGNTLTLDCGGEAFTYQATGASNGKIDKTGAVVAAGSGVAGWEWGEAYHTLSATGSLTITLHSSASTEHQWANYDNVELYYYGNGVELEAEAKNAGEQFTTVAGQWYVIPVATDGDYVFTVGDGSNVTYTQKGNTPESGTFSTATSSVAYSLTKGYVYLKTETATNVNFDANSYTYTVGEATADVSCIQPGKTVTISYNKAVTNDPNATFEKLGTVTFNGTTITPVLSGTSFTFTVPEGLETSKAYTLSIPAGAFGYDGGATCSAQEITFNTPAVFDGTYFVKAADGTYISRGAEYGTEAARDPWGIALKIATNGNNVTTFTFIDNEKPLAVASGGDMYTDNNTLKYEFTLTAVEGGYNIKNKYYDTYVVAGTNSKGKDVAKTAADPYVWTLVAPAAHAAEMTALKNNQAASAAASAQTSGATGLDGVTDVESLKTALASWPEGNAIELPALNSTGEFYQASGTRSAEVEITTAGLYKFAMPAYCRPNSPDKAYSTYCDHTDALTAYIFIGDTKTQVRSLYSEEGKAEATTDYVQPAGAKQWWANTRTTGTAEFNAGKYVNEVWVWLETGKYNFGIGRDGKGNCGDWTWFGTPTLTHYSLDLYPTFAELYEKCKPWTESTAADDYVAIYNSYSTYTEATEIATLQAAINYLNEKFDTYAWENASLEHPYLVEGVISRSDCTTNGDQDPYKDWAGSGRSTKTGQHWSGDASRVYFTQNHESGAARSQTVTIPSKGVYMLKTSIRPINSAAYAEISVGSETVRTYGPTGTTGGTIATDGKEYESVEAGIAAGATFANGNNGFGWIYQNLIFNTSADNETKEIKINLSNQNDNREADCGGMFLYYVGQTYDKIEGNTHYYYGNYATAPSFEVTEDVPVVDATKAAVTGATVTRTNPNGLVYLASGSTADGNNVVIDGTCANLVLTDGYPFTATKNFTATNASYNMTAVAGGKFGTLMLPFAVTTLPGKAYSLDADINAIDGTINGSEVTSVPANRPVLVTAAGNYAGSNVDVAVTSASSLYTNGHLTGVYQATSAPVGSYVLQNHTATNGVAFYLVDNVQPTVKPFRAYIPALNNNVKAIKVIFDGDTTGISDIDNDNNSANDIIYDLSGRKVTKAHKGVYIINGKKTVK